MHKIERKSEVLRLKKEIKEMLSDMGISMRVFRKTLPKMSRTTKQKASPKSGYQYRVDAEGKFPSLRQRWTFLKELSDFKKKKEKEEKEKSK